jgi:hypothetical protein
VLLNPAIHPWTDLERYLGEQPLYHGGGSVVVERKHLQELLDLRVDDHQTRALLPAGRHRRRSARLSRDDRGLSGRAHPHHRGQRSRHQRVRGLRRRRTGFLWLYPNGKTVA